MGQEKDITKKWKWKQISEKERYAIEALPRARRIFGYKTANDIYNAA
jgi:hypothetical protein